ncbi:hypothetical protein MTX78_22855 [Hymenobacter tibetensis]|uniref:Uncharacterized protein n=1 Tax=Hymenobacter tibetensis TaxID=497967 RepID=A0ABY4CXE7_9BACT|nr:hypothetical protein [Hymenobacter tibetensis]UOG74943.1 hypothetical protein MTX78_22855 [Hymenobacter tibetensis]
MKRIPCIAVALSGLFFSHCTSKPDVEPALNYDQASQALMQEVALQLVGTWKLRQVHVSYKRLSGHAFIPLTRDTLFQEFATLLVQRAVAPRTSPEHPLYPEFQGTLTFRGKALPVYFQLIANPEQVVKQQGPQALFMLDTNFPAGSRTSGPEEDFMENLGLLRENFSLELTSGQPTMIWRGLNHGVDRIELQKQ